MNRNSIIEKVSSLKERLEELGVAQIGLFGSFARDEATADSDLDFLIEFHPGMKSFDNLMELKILLEDTFPGKKIDVALKENLKPRLKEGILSEVQYAS